MNWFSSKKPDYVIAATAWGTPILARDKEEGRRIQAYLREQERELQDLKERVRTIRQLAERIAQQCDRP